MKSKLLPLFFLFITSTLFAQNENPYAYNNAIITDDQPTSVKEYYYDYDEQTAKHVQNHTLKYNAEGLLTERIESSEGLLDLPQTYRYRFQYDSKSRLIYYWNEQLIGSVYKSQNEQQWIYDSNDMITEDNQWSVTNGTKYLGANSYKRVITRDVNNKVLKIEKSIYTSTADDDDLVLVLDKVYTFKYDANNILDSIIVFRRNVTLDGIMTLESKQYDFQFKNYDVLNTDLLEYNSYQTSNYNGVKTNIVNTYDAEGRILTETETYEDDELINETEYTYESDKITIANLYEKKIYYIDASGRSWKYETYVNYDEEWELENPAYTMNTRTFENGKIVSDLYKNQYNSETGTYKNDVRYDYEYSSLPTGIVASNVKDVVFLYPNPSAGMVYVNGFQNMQKLSISSITGATLSLPLQEQIDLSGLAAGVYIVTAEYNNQTSDIQRLIVK